jgi:SH3-like domain-containing protein
VSAADQLDQLDRAVQAVASARADRRLHVFDVKAVRVGERVTISGRVLSRDDLKLLRVAVREALPAETPVDDGGVQVLRQDPPAVRVVATTLTDLHAGPSFLSEMLTQVTNGVELEVLQEEGEWCYVRQRDGYLGWAHAPYLADAGEADTVAATHLVSAPALPLYASAESGRAPVACLPMGTAVAVVES